jgi:hypothetical protein
VTCVRVLECMRRIVVVLDAPWAGIKRGLDPFQVVRMARIKWNQISYDYSTCKKQNHNTTDN